MNAVHVRKGISFSYWHLGAAALNPEAAFFKEISSVDKRAIMLECITYGRIVTQQLSCIIQHP